ncbi:beta-ketoacyl-[acyl-carrier-protein] synthase family protein [Streptacidiphilus neutrinimicus]|uniref:beta-ketoacyl-[acyl-carrier-protein] synthase family protein n=1 Tax=Streptacidiphilus neutrinimicus TaxID=105420 RepID=UPI0005A7AF0E|nr:beta-ketoacyl-[acyl-carrier-protein] synthase family protein [Streptacidiphilus neutrinimicus]
MRRRVVITGLGPVSSVGIGTEEFATALQQGESGISPISSFDATGFPHRMAGEVPAFDPKQMLEHLDPREWGRTSLFAAAAARLAVQDSGIDPAALSRARAGSSIGTTSGESQVIEELTAQWVAGSLKDLDPALIRATPASRLAVAVNRELGLTGEALTLSTACSASNYALGHAYATLATGEADYMIAGGADSVCRWAHAGFYRLGALTEFVCSPFDRDRSGILTGEGGAALFLEPLESAERRGARIYAEVLGYGLNCDASHMVAPDPVSIAECMRRAHRKAGIDAAQVDYICAHGTGTPANDAMETQAVLEVFGPKPPPISSIKSMLGHTMGAASGFGAIASALGIARQFIPPTINFRTPDPQMPGIDPVAGVARPARLRVVQNNGFAFGGNNAITILGEVA